jgi:hypothetical protein
VDAVPEFVLWPFYNLKVEALEGRALEDPLWAWNLREQPFAYLSGQRFHYCVILHLVQDFVYKVRT